ncbi:MAG: hypothetical protein U5R06_00550 [candidate division KSB1 bacterium]|nr:hypothetical protein [candidate division KSB1 bacterium]
MLNRSILLFCACILFTGAGRTQSISEQLKQADCQFEIYYGDQKLDVIKQMITKRGIIKGHAEGDYAYNSYFLEFLYQSDLIIKKKEKGKAWMLLKVKFISEADVILKETVLDDEEMKDSIIEGERQKYFSISLIDVPVFILDNTYKINIIKQ